MGDEREVRVGRHEVLADTLDGPGAGLDRLSRLDQRREDRTERVGQDHLGLRRDAREEAAEPRQRAAGADAADHGIDVVIHLLPDLGAGGGLMGERVGRIGELVDEMGLVLRRDALGHVLIIFGVALADVGARHAHIGAERPQVQDLLACHLVGHHEDDFVALGGRDLGEAEAGVAGCGLHNRAAGLQRAAFLRRLDHGKADAVLDRPAGVLALQLGEEPARAGVEMRQLDQRRVADEIEGGTDGAWWVHDSKAGDAAKG